MVNNKTVKIFGKQFLFSECGNNAFFAELRIISKAERIAWKTLIGEYRKGGYRIPDLDLQIKALKTSGLIKAAEIEGTWKEYLLQHLPMQDLNYFLRSNLRYCDLPYKPQKNDFWMEALVGLHWCCMNYQDIVVGIMDQNLW